MMKIYILLTLMTTLVACASARVDTIEELQEDITVQQTERHHIENLEQYQCDKAGTVPEGVSNATFAKIIVSNVTKHKQCLAKNNTLIQIIILKQDKI